MFNLNSATFFAHSELLHVTVQFQYNLKKSSMDNDAKQYEKKSTSKVSYQTDILSTILSEKTSLALLQLVMMAFVIIIWTE
jgi:hypothetical protein